MPEPDVHSHMAPEMDDRQMDAVLENDPLMTVEEVAHYLRVTPATVRAMAKSGRLVGKKVGPRWRFRKAVVKELVLP